MLSSPAVPQVPQWVFQGTADHQWKSYDDTWQNLETQNTYPTGEGGI